MIVEAFTGSLKRYLNTHMIAMAVACKSILIRYIEQSRINSIRQLSDLLVKKNYFNITNFRKSYRNLLSSHDLSDIRIMQFIGSLGPGGSERQFCNLVSGLKKNGNQNIEVVSYSKLEGKNAHYLELLQKEHIPVSALDLSIRQESGIPGINMVYWGIRREVASMYRKIKQSSPDILHVWLDRTNVIGALAGILAGVPLIVISTRSVSPANFPRFHHFYFRPYYKLFSKCSGIYFLNNSHNGAKDYAGWMECSEQQISVILNGIDPESVHRISNEEKINFRKSINISDDKKIVCGVFRLTAEKRPFMFIDIAAEVLKTDKELVFIHAGDGELLDSAKRYVQKLGIGDRFKFLGRRKDTHVIINSSDACLLTSKIEGTPNIILEAQLLGCPVVAPKVGGIPDCIKHGETGFINDVNDKHGMAENLLLILGNKNLKEQFGENGRRFILEKFSLAEMLKNTKAFYHDILSKE